jgi:hypothetical protein
LTPRWPTTLLLVFAVVAPLTALGALVAGILGATAGWLVGVAASALLLHATENDW